MPDLVQVLTFEENGAADSLTVEFRGSIYDVTLHDDGYVAVLPPKGGPDLTRPDLDRIVKVAEAFPAVRAAIARSMGVDDLLAKATEAANTVSLLHQQVTR